MEDIENGVQHDEHTSLLMNGHRSSGTTITYRDLAYSVGKKSQRKVVLSGVSGILKPGQLVVILGPSGSGKTTLLDCLAGRAKGGKLSGEILVNGRPRDKYLKRISGYVTQEDVLLPSFTIRETLTYAAELRLPSSVSSQQRYQRVDRLIRELGLLHVAESRIGGLFARGISGGEKRRVSIGLELITEPDVLFLDEPTSGLDSYAAVAVMEVLLRMAQKQNRTVVCTLHQPSSKIFAMCDQLILLAKGCVVYQGPAADAVAHFASLGYECPPNFNPADFFLGLLSEDMKRSQASADFHNREAAIVSTAFLAEKFAQSPIGTLLQSTSSQAHLSGALSQAGPTAAPHKVAEYNTGFIWQFGVLARRNLQYSFRTPTVMGQRAVGCLLSALLVALMFSQLKANADEQLTLALSFELDIMGVMAFFAIPTYISERQVFTREHAAGWYRTSAYYLANVLSILPANVVLTLTYSSLIYFIIGLRSGSWHFFTFLLANCLTMEMFLAQNESIGALFASVGPAISTAGLLLIIAMQFNGVFVNYPNIPKYLRPLYWASPLTYSVSAVMLNQWQGKSSGEEWLDQYGIQLTDKRECLYILAVFVVVWRVACYFALRIAARGKQ